MERVTGRQRYQQQQQQHCIVVLFMYRNRIDKNRCIDKPTRVIDKSSLIRPNHQVFVVKKR